MRDPAPHWTRSDPTADAAKYGLIVAAISLAIITVLLGIGSNFVAALGRLAGVGS